MDVDGQFSELVATCKWVRLRDKDWEHICDELSKGGTAIERYLPPASIKPNSEDQQRLATWLMFNDDFVSCCLELEAEGYGQDE